MLFMLLLALASMMLFTTTASADVADYIRGVCEDYGGQWSDDNMACNDFESETDQWNFGDALMDRDTYDEKVEQCEEKGGDWSDENAKCTIQDDEERAAYEDAICDDGSCNENLDYDNRVNHDFDEDAVCYLDGERLDKDDDRYWSICD